MKANGLIWSSTALCLLLLSCSGKENNTVDCQKNFTVSCERELNSMTVQSNPILKASLAGAGCAQGNAYACALLRHSEWQRRAQEDIGYLSEAFSAPEFPPSSESLPRSGIDERFCQLSGSERENCLSALRTLNGLKTKMDKEFRNLDHSFPPLEQKNWIIAQPQNWLNRNHSFHRGYYRDQSMIERNGQTRGRTKVCYWQEGKDPVCHSYVVGDPNSRLDNEQEDGNDPGEGGFKKKKDLTPFKIEDRENRFIDNLCQNHDPLCENNLLSASTALWLTEHPEAERAQASSLDPVSKGWKQEPDDRVSTPMPHGKAAAAIRDTLPFRGVKKETAPGGEKSSLEGKSGSALSSERPGLVLSNEIDRDEESGKMQTAAPSVGFVSALSLIAAKNRRLNQEALAREQALATQAAGGSKNDVILRETSAMPRANSGFATVLRAIAAKKRLNEAIDRDSSTNQFFALPYTRPGAQGNSIPVKQYSSVETTGKDEGSSMNNERAAQTSSHTAQVEPEAWRQFLLHGAPLGERDRTGASYTDPMDTSESEALTAPPGDESVADNKKAADRPVPITQQQSQAQGQDASPSLSPEVSLSAEDKQKIAKTSQDLALLLQGTAQGKQQGLLEVQARKLQEVQQNQQKLKNLQGAKARGIVMQKDRDRRVALDKACANHQAQACYQLAIAYARGNDMPFDYPRAQEKYRQVCRDAAKGDAQNQYYCGLMQSEGVVVKKNLASGRNWLKKSCQQHYVLACHVLERWQKQDAKTIKTRPLYRRIV